MRRYTHHDVVLETEPQRISRLDAALIRLAFHNIPALIARDPQRSLEGYSR